MERAFWHPAFVFCFRNTGSLLADRRKTGIVPCRNQAHGFRPQNIRSHDTVHDLPFCDSLFYVAGQATAGLAPAKENGALQLLQSVPVPGSDKIINARVHGFAPNSIGWNTGEYDTRSAQGLSEGSGLWPFILGELKRLETKFSERAKTQNFKRVS